MECDTLSDNDEDDRSTTLSYRLKLHAADPRYITSSEDCNRGDVICTVEQVKEPDSQESHCGGWDCCDLAYDG